MLTGVGTASEGACATPLRCSSGSGPAVLLINSVTLGKLHGTFKFQLLNIEGNN